MKKKTELHPALRALTTKEYDALWPKPPTQQGIRPLTLMIVCDECERLTDELRIMTADISGSAARNMDLMAENRQLKNENEALRELIETTAPHIIKEQSRKIGAID